MRKSASTVRILPFVTTVSTFVCASIGLASAARMPTEIASRLSVWTEVFFGIRRVYVERLALGAYGLGVS